MHISTLTDERLLQSCAESLLALLDSELGKTIVAIPERELSGMVLNDFYKPKMHKLYSTLYTAVEADFQLKIRKTPFTLERISDEASSCAVHQSACEVTTSLYAPRAHQGCGTLLQCIPFRLAC